MTPAIKEYSDALEAHLEARREEVRSRDRVRKTLGNSDTLPTELTINGVVYVKK